jgi:hypothetical protein
MWFGMLSVLRVRQSVPLSDMSWLTAAWFFQEYMQSRSNSLFGAAAPASIPHELA